MICPNCKKENMNEYATVCAYCEHELYQGNTQEKARELVQKQKNDKMNSIIKILISIILVIAIAIVALVIPKPEKDGEESTANSVDESTTITNSEETAQNIAVVDNEENTTIKNLEETTQNGVTNSEEKTTAKSESTTKPVESTAKGDSDSAKTTEEIVEYFNKNANRVKTEATKVVKNYEDREVSNIQASDLLKKTAGGVMDAAFKDDTDPIIYGTREEIVENFQVPKQTYVSKLTADDVAEATFTEDGNQYIITIRAKDEKNPVVGKGVGSAFDIIEASEVKEKAPPFVKNFSTDYHNCVVKATFDKETGRMVAANYTVRLTLFVTAFSENASMDLSFEKDYTITY